MVLNRTLPASSSAAEVVQPPATPNGKVKTPAPAAPDGRPASTGGRSESTPKRGKNLLKAMLGRNINAARPPTPSEPSSAVTVTEPVPTAAELATTAPSVSSSVSSLFSVKSVFAFLACCKGPGESELAAAVRNSGVVGKAVREAAKAKKRGEASGLGQDPQVAVAVESAGLQKPEKKWLLRPIERGDVGKKCLVLDLDETLVHSTFKPIPNPDFVVPVEIENTTHLAYVLKRPHVETFLKRMGELYELVVFTASVGEYANKVLDTLDTNRVIKHRLFREACIHHKGSYVKDLSLLGRSVRRTMIIDNAPVCYLFHPANAVPITTWFNDPLDAELLDLVPLLEDMAKVDDVQAVLDSMNDDGF